MWKMYITENYVRFRVRDPRKFIPTSFKTHDVGRAGHTKRISGKLKRNLKWATQSILINKEDYPRIKRIAWFRYMKSRYKKKR